MGFDFGDAHSGIHVINFFTAMISLGVSRRELIGRKFVITFLITMLFNGGIIPYYLLLHKLHMINNFRLCDSRSLAHGISL